MINWPWCIGLLIALALAGPTVAEERALVEGWGAFPISPTATALWINGPSERDRGQPLLMVYYRGPSGWHDRKWKFEGVVRVTPARVRLVSQDLELSIDYGAETVSVQGTAVDVSKANVFLVAPMAESGHESEIKPLGLVTFTVPASANPALQVLETNPDIARKVLGHSGSP